MRALAAVVSALEQLEPGGLDLLEAAAHERLVRAQARQDRRGAALTPSGDPGAQRPARPPVRMNLTKREGVDRRREPRAATLETLLAPAGRRQKGGGAA